MYNLEGGVIWTQELKNAFKTGTTYCSVIHNQQEYNESNFLKEAELKDVKYVPNAGFIGQAVSKMLTIKMVNDEESNLNFENANVQFKIGAKYNDIIYYINYGNFIVNEPPENDDTNGTVKFIAYDYMIKFNQDYTNRVSYPCTLKDLLLDICSQAGVELGSITFHNEDFEVEDNQFEGKQLRDVLQHIAKCAFSWARIGQDNKVYLDFVVNNNIDEIITIDDYKLDAFKKANEYYGPVNKVTFADSDIKGQEISVIDNASIQTNGLKEIIIYDNYFAYNIEKREELIQEGTSLFGLRYMPIQNLELIGLVYLDCVDIIGVQDGAGTTYLTRVFSHTIKYNGVVSDIIETTGESDNEKLYSNPNNSVAQNSRTEIIVDRAKKQITAVVEEVGQQNQKIARVTQTVDELNSKISDIADITTSLESNSARLEFENINQSEPIRVVIHPVGTNIAKLHPSPSLKPSSNLKIRTRVLRFTNTTTQEVWNYELPDDLLYYDNENYDEFQLDYEAQTCIINKKCKWNNDGTVGLLVNERTDEYTFPHIELTDGDYTVQLIQYNSGYLFVRLMAQNIYTTQFATKAELNSEISQTVDNINLSVNQRLTNYSTTSQMNSAIDLKANQITSTVSESYSTKAETATAKNEAIASANSTTDQKLQSYSTTTEMNSAITQKANEISSVVSQKVGYDELGTKIQQNYQSVQIAWNNISEYIQFINSQLQIKNNNKLLMALTRYGQYFYNEGSHIGTIGTSQYVGDNSQKALSFQLNENGKYMGWFQRSSSEGIFYSVLYYARANSFGETNEGIYVTKPLYVKSPIYLKHNLHTDYDIFVNASIFLNEELRINSGVMSGIDGGYYYEVGFGDAINDAFFRSNRIETNISGTLYIDGREVVTNSSDARLKHDIYNSDINALDRISQIKHRKFIWNEDNKEEQIGYIAQELENIDENYVIKSPQRNENGEVIDYIYQVNLLPILATATKAIQELKEEVDEIKEQQSKQQQFLEMLASKFDMQEEYNDIFAKETIKKSIKRAVKYDNINEQYNKPIQYSTNFKQRKNKVKDKDENKTILAMNDNGEIYTVKEKDIKGGK